MRVLVSYDIADDGIRRRIMKTCEAFGQRVQRSVFECSLTSEQLESLRERLDAARQGTETEAGDSIRLYQICAECGGKVTVLGFDPVTVVSGKAVIIG